MLSLVFTAALTLLLLAQTALGQEIIELTEDSAPAGWGVSLFPAIFYSPETKFGGGGGMILTHRHKDALPEVLPSTISFVGLYTTRNQSILVLSPEYTDPTDHWRLRGYLLYRDFPAYFYGVGNDTREEDREKYTAETWMVQPWVMRRLGRRLRLGFLYDLRRTTILERVDDGLIQQEQRAGRGGGLNSGLGPVLEWDSRDNAFYPTAGGWYQLLAVFYDSEIGSGFDFESYTIDGRQYISIGGRNVIAAQLYGTVRRGNVPVSDLNPLDERVRGVQAERFRDRVLLASQVEYRFPLVGRFRGALFLAAGQVGATPKEMCWRDVRAAAGGGLRFILNPQEQTAIRFDLGASDTGVEFYFQWSEAF